MCLSFCQALGQGVSPTDLFDHFDCDGPHGKSDGKIDHPELIDGLKRLGIYVTQAEAAALLAMFNDGRGCVTLFEFISAVDHDGLPTAKQEVVKKRPLVRRPSPKTPESDPLGKRPSPKTYESDPIAIELPKGEFSDGQLMVRPYAPRLS